MESMAFFRTTAPDAAGLAAIVALGGVAGLAGVAGFVAVVAFGGVVVGLPAAVGFVCENPNPVEKPSAHKRIIFFIFKFLFDCITNF